MKTPDNTPHRPDKTQQPRRGDFPKEFATEVEWRLASELRDTRLRVKDLDSRLETESDVANVVRRRIERAIDRMRIKYAKEGNQYLRILVEILRIELSAHKSPHNVEEVRKDTDRQMAEFRALEKKYGREAVARAREPLDELQTVFETREHEPVALAVATETLKTSRKPGSFVMPRKFTATSLGLD